MTIDNFKIWDIWTVMFKFEDSTQKKLRPVLLLDKNKSNQVLVAKITTHQPRNNFFGEYEIKNWREAGLSRPSIVRLSKQIYVDKQDLKKYCGHIRPIDILYIQKILFSVNS